MLRKIKNRAFGWRPLVLYWRRRDSRRPLAKTDRVMSSVSLSYFPQIHLHTTCVNIQNRERVLLERRFGTRIYTDKSQTRLIEHHHHYLSSSKHSALIRQIQQLRTGASIKSVFTVFRNTRREELVKVSRTERYLREYQSQVRSTHTTQRLSFRSAQKETLVKSTQVYFDRAEELVWRRNQPRTLASEDAPVEQNTEITQRPTVRTPATTTHAQSVSASSVQTTPQQITKFDPNLLDRLTDDVIRRVEKRALVERQRRGL